MSVTPDLDALRVAVAWSGRPLHVHGKPAESLRTIGRRAAEVFGEPEKAHSFTVTLSSLLSGKATSVATDRLEAIEVALGRAPGDLKAPVYHVFRRLDDLQPIQFGLAGFFFTSPEQAVETRGFLNGISTPDEARGRMFAVDPTPMFAHERERWLERNFDRLDAREREFVVMVDPDERALRSLWYAHLVTVDPSAERRTSALGGLAGFVEEGRLDAVDFAALTAIAARRLECDRLRDAPHTTYRRWRAEAENLADAALTIGTMS